MMGFKDNFFVYTVLVSLTLARVLAQGGHKGKLPRSRFSCVNKPSGYYADVDTGCEVYHMCDGLGRQFSYKCPNMTLFQQRMLICDHWYMVNCSMSEKDYDANLLIGQRDKPFVSEDEMRMRTPRPDILSVPPYNPYLDILREDTKFRDLDNNDLDTKQSQNHFRPPTGWSAGQHNRRQDTVRDLESKTDNYRADQYTSEEPQIIHRSSESTKLKNKPLRKVDSPRRELLPPFIPLTRAADDEKSQTLKSTEHTDPVFKFIKRFDPNSDGHETAMTKSEILAINTQLPEGQVSSEEDRTPRKHKKTGSDFNTFKTHNDKSFSEDTRFDSVNIKSKAAEATKEVFKGTIYVPEPKRALLPPKEEYSVFVSTTIGPPIYYEWRWAVPAFDLVPPKQDNETNSTNTSQTRSVDKFEGRNPFSSVTRPEPITTTPVPYVVEYNTSSYLVPDYVFPLDKEHPGYENENAQTSFQVDVAKPGKASYGENPQCPQCHPAYLEPGSCEPCIVKR